jgi:alkylation response protein AidB-like acyl-CoA dehydrogenase
MDYTLSSVDADLQGSYRRFFEDRCGISQVRSSELSGFDAAMWRELQAMGTLAMMFEPADERVNLLQTTLIAEEAGRALAPVPLIEATVAARVLAEAVGDLPEGFVPRVVAGEHIPTITLRAQDADWSALVPSGAIAGSMIGLNRGRLTLSTIDERRPPPRNLGCLPMADCHGVDHIVLAAGEEARRAYTRAVADWKTLTSAALLGLAEAALRIVLEYVKIRRAFGVLIGSFQSVQHRLADARVALDGLRFLTYKAAWAADHGRADAVKLANMAFLFAAQTSQQTAAEALHFHGGIGYTREHDIQLYFRRAKAWALALGDPERVAQELADELYGPREV